METFGSAAPLSDLVDTHHIRSAVRRLFTGGLDEILGELFQNSQRAGAQTVDLAHTPTGWTYRDDGHGVAGVAGFHTLLRLADSHFADPQVATDQQPMGLGLHALLAHADVTAVTFRSQGWQLVVDTTRWWNDAAYYRSWAERLTGDPTPPPTGLWIAVTAASPTPTPLDRILRPTTDGSPAQGYSDLLIIRLDGQSVVTADPTWLETLHTLFTGSYAGCPIRLGFGRRPYSRYADRSAINWYGQIIPVATPFQGHFFYHLTVRQGQPVTPRAPSRQGVVADAQLAALHAWVETQLFAYLAAQPRAALQPEWVEAAYAINPARAATLPWFVAAPWQPAATVESFADVQSTGPSELCAYDALPMLVEPDLQVILAPDTAAEPYAYGHETLLPLLAPPTYRLRAGAPERLTLHQVWWRPGLPDGDLFYGPGCWGVGTAAAPPAQWQLVPPEQTVWAFQAPDDWSVEGVEGWVVAAPHKLAFYAGAAWAGFDGTNSETDEETLRDAYAASCAAARRALVGAAVPRDWTLQDVIAALPRGSGQIHSIACEYDTPTAVLPVARRVTLTTGQEMRLWVVD